MMRSVKAESTKPSKCFGALSLRKSSYVLLAIAGLTSGASGKDCLGPDVEFVPGGTTELLLYLKPNTICDIHFQAASSDRGVFGIRSSRVTERPIHGILGKTSIRHYALKPNTDFIGDDSFIIEVNYYYHNDVNTTRLHYTVHVQNSF